MDKKNTILAASLAILILATIAYKAPLTQKAQQPEVNILTVDQLNSADEIILESADKNFSIKKEGERWKVSNTKSFYADNEKVSRFLSAIKKTGEESLELVSVSSSKKDQLLPKNSSIAVTIKKSGNKEIEVVVAKAPSRSGSYISLAGKNETYLTKTDIVTLVGADDWIDLTIFSGNKDDINRLRLQYPGSEFAMEKKDDKWSGVKPFIFPVSSNKIDEILDIMTNLQGVKIPTQDYKGTGLEKNLIIVQASGANINNTIMVGEADKDGNYFAKRGDSDNIYLITKKQRDELVKKINDLR
jgi:hypothetical protein